MFKRARTTAAATPARGTGSRSSSSFFTLTRCQNIIAIGAKTPSDADPAMMVTISPREVPGVKGSGLALSTTRTPVAMSQG